MRLEPVAFSSLQNWPNVGHVRPFQAIRATALASLAQLPELRPAKALDPALKSVFAAAAALENPDESQARNFFESHFTPHRIFPDDGAGFLTGYYEPEVFGSLVKTAEFTTPILARPHDLITFNLDAPEHLASLAAAQKLPNGDLVAYPTRAEIESGAIGQQTQPIVYLADAVEVFLIQVQGSARVILPDCRRIRLRYAGRNGHPYSSIGKILIAENHIAAESMTLARLKAWLRANIELGRAIMQRNLSYVFFEIEPNLSEAEGPIGGGGVPLTPLVSLAIDRTLWSYGLPFWIEAELPLTENGTESFNRLMIAQDTGSAIVGAARADLYFGSGDQAGVLAGNIRHPAHLTVFLPKPIELASS